MADAFGMKPEEVMSMRNDAHPTNFAENVQFFLNSSNPTNFERTWKNASYVYRELGRINAPVPFDQVMDFSVHPEAAEEGDLRQPEGREHRHLHPVQLPEGPGRSADPDPDDPDQLLSQFGQSLRARPRRARQRRSRASSMIPNVDATLEQVARLVGPVRPGRHPDRGPHGFEHEGPRSGPGRAGPEPCPGRGHQAGPDREVQVRSQQVQRRGQGLGRARRIRTIRTTRR